MRPGAQSERRNPTLVQLILCELLDQRRAPQVQEPGCLRDDAATGVHRLADKVALYRLQMRLEVRRRCGVGRYGTGLSPTQRRGISRADRLAQSCRSVSR